MYCSLDDTFNVQNLTQFINAEQENLCLEEECIAKHMKDYLKYSGRDVNEKLQFTATDVSKCYFMYIIQRLNLITPTAKMTPNFNNL